MAAQKGNYKIVNYLLEQPKIKIIPNQFTMCSKLTEIKLPYRCFSLEKISIPSSLSFIENSAFEECISLKTLTIPSTVARIGDFCFFECRSLQHINIPSLINVIGNWTFRNCISLADISIPSSVKIIGNYSFAGCISLKQISIPESVVKIGCFAFNGCTNLTEISIPSNVTVIEPYTFAGCSSLIKIELPNSIELIKDYAFNECTSLVEISLPSSVKLIGESSFSGCSSLKNLSIPRSVEEIEDHAFFNCSSLNPIEIPSSVKKVGNFIFDKFSNEYHNEEEEEKASNDKYAKYSINEEIYQMEQQVGMSHFGRSYVVSNKMTGKVYVEKYVNYEDGDLMNHDFMSTYIENDIRLHINANHPTFIKFYGYWYKKATVEKIGMISESSKIIYSLDNLFKDIRRGLSPEGFGNTQLQIILIGISRGMKYLSDCGMNSNIINPTKILLDSNFHPYINCCDLTRYFGSKGFDNLDIHLNYYDLIYTPPEFFKDSYSGDEKSSVFSFAMMMHFMLTYNEDYVEARRLNNFVFLNRVVNENLRPRITNDFINEPYRKLICQCWSENPDDRLTFKEIFRKLAYDDDYYLDEVEVQDIKSYVNEITKK